MHFIFFPRSYSEVTQSVVHIITGTRTHRLLPMFTKALQSSQCPLFVGIFSFEVSSHTVLFIHSINHAFTPAFPCTALPTLCNWRAPLQPSRARLNVTSSEKPSMIALKSLFHASLCSIVGLCIYHRLLWLFN